MTTQEFIDKIKWRVVRSTQKTALFPSVAMAQAILESSSGNSTLALNANNLFGIKAYSGWSGGVVYANDDLPNEPFRAYQTVNDSIADHNSFLYTNSRYADNGVFTATTPEEQAQALQTAGYATAPNYANSLINLINKYDLKKLDNLKITMKYIDKSAMIILILLIIYFVLKYFKKV